MSWRNGERLHAGPYKSVLKATGHRRSAQEKWVGWGPPLRSQKNQHRQNQDVQCWDFIVSEGFYNSYYFTFSQLITMYWTCNQYGFRGIISNIMLKYIINKDTVTLTSWSKLYPEAYHGWRKVCRKQMEMKFNWYNSVCKSQWNLK